MLHEIHWSVAPGFPILGLLQLIPFATLLIVSVTRSDNWAFRIALAGVLLELVGAMTLYRLFEVNAGQMQFAEQFGILGFFSYHAAVDGISVLFVLTTAILTLLVVLYGRVRMLLPAPSFLATVLAVETALISLFVTVDLLWFIVMSLFELVLVGHILRRWATSAERDLAFTRYVQFMGIGLLLVVVGALMVAGSFAESHNDRWTFDLFILQSGTIPAAIQSVVFFLLFYGLAVRIPLFPMHGWLPLASEHGTVAVSGVFLLGIKAGVYGMLRFVFPLVPDAIIYWQPFIVAFAVAGIFYAATLAMMQVNLRRLLAFAVVSHTSILVIGLFTLNHLALHGSVILSVNFGVAIAGLLFMTGFVFRRRKTMLLSRLGGLFDRIPLIGITFLAAGLAIIGMPGTPGFDAAHLILEASIERFGALVTIAAALGNVVAAGFLLWSFQRAFLAPVEGVKADIDSTESTLPMERVVAWLFLIVLLSVGFYSEPLLDLVEGSLGTLDALYGKPAH